ncbi:hypothetical protein [Haloarcula amylovorans]|uniref:hypothetical protein n=1 Tax=Haloarcula amylovorans TaxID=2562280 RepID=UPI001076756B|nr:hypothetical protein [Halomicroarcula amylolytica]
MTQSYPIIEITTHFGGSLGEKTGRFEFRKASVNEQIRTGLLAENSFSQALGALNEFFTDGTANRIGISADVGGGQHLFEINLESLGADDGQWGYTDDTGTLNEATATGGNREQKAQVFLNYLRKGSPDSLHPATLIYGEYSPSGIMSEDSLPVYFEDPEMNVSRDQSSVFEGSLTAIETLDVSEAATRRETTD